MPPDHPVDPAPPGAVPELGPTAGGVAGWSGFAFSIDGVWAKATEAVTDNKAAAIVTLKTGRAISPSGFNHPK